MLNSVCNIRISDKQSEYCEYWVLILVSNTEAENVVHNIRTADRHVDWTLVVNLNMI
jgi:hypothetical protein